MERDRHFLELVDLLREFRKNSVWERLQGENPEIYSVFHEFFSSITEANPSHLRHGIAEMLAMRQAQQLEVLRELNTLALEQAKQKQKQEMESERIRF